MGIIRRKATLRDVAHQAGVSVATVSRVLNTPDKVAASTRDRVGASIDALRFRPSAAARSLNSGATKMIGILVPTIDHSIFAQYVQSLEATLSAQDYGLIVAVTGGCLALEAKKSRDLLNLGVDGLIVSGVLRDPAFDKLVDRFEIPVLATSYFDQEAPYPTIGYDNAAVAEMAVRYLRDCGHQRIAIVHGPVPENDRIAARIAGAERACLETPLRLYPAELSVTGGATAARAIFQDNSTDRAARCSAVLCMSDVQALGVLFDAQRRELRVPEDISIMGFDDLEWSRESNPPLTTIRLPSKEMGEAAAMAMIAHLREDAPFVPRELAAKIIERGSVSIGSWRDAK